MGGIVVGLYLIGWEIGGMESRFVYVKEWAVARIVVVKERNAHNTRLD